MATNKQNNQLNEKDAIQDILFAEKSLVKMYGTAITESSGKPVRTAVKSLLSTAIADQYSVYSAMNDFGYYEPAPADKAVIDEQKDKFTKISQSF